MTTIVPILTPQPNSSKISETIKSEPTQNDSNTISFFHTSFFERFSLENPHQQTLNELSPDLNEAIDQAFRRLLSNLCLITLFSGFIGVGYHVSTTDEIKPPGVLCWLAVAAGWVMLSTGVDLGLVHDYLFIAAMAMCLTMDWTTRGQVIGESLGVGIAYISTTTLPFKGPLLRNHVDLIMLLIFKIARVGYGHDKVSALRDKLCVAKPASNSITTTYIISSTT